MRELLLHFGIDWKLLIAQVVNFVILLFILQKFSYKPVIKMLNDRRRKIEEGMEASDAAQKSLHDALQEKKYIVTEAEKEALHIISGAETTAESQAKNIINSAHTKAEQVIMSGQKKLHEHQKNLEAEVEKHAHILIQESLKKVILKMNPEERDKALISEAVRELKTLSS